MRWRILTSTQAEDSPGFLDALLNILQAEQDNAVRLSCMRQHTHTIWEGAMSD